ncbi:hypothetical protein [Amycolatopsis suaedae]|uniref:Uncharacterized protein n=1 Tax=Amycolatopsis suaedae TaxID=2510978 RepID=A0A4Q7IWJ1_9PSEU|nr:hypothetical protein [Amycolatopsis suaedae]RZQ59291.1 hypothetical protein EWH70_35040 [Amycolatopsis suaedae]
MIEPLRRTLRAWPRWTGYAAAAWSFGYGTLGLLWTLGVPGFPFGEGDVPDARGESLFGTTTAAGFGPVLAAIGYTGAVVAFLLARTRSRILVALGACYTALLLVAAADFRVLLAIAYAPIALVSIFGWPPVDYFTTALPWPVLNMLLCQAGGLLWLGATLTALRRGRDACAHCGRAEHTAAWTTPAAAARWGRVAAYIAFLVPLFYALLRASWVLRIPLGMSAGELDELHANGLVWAGLYLACFATLGGVLTLGLVYRWGEIWPRWIPGLRGKPVPRGFPLVFASVVTAALLPTVAGVVRIGGSDLTTLLTSPMTYWPLWAVCLGAATLAYHYRTRRACRVCGRGTPVVELPGPVPA